MTTCDCEQSVAIYRKRDRTLRITITGPGDLTGAKIWFSVKRDLDDEDADALIVKKSANNGGDDTEAKVYDGENGIIEVYIVPDDTEEIDEGDYWFDVVIETSSGRRLEAVGPSRFRILQPVTVT